ncbi:MAG: adenylyltransferase/cytidyltransferase family protein [Bacteroidales bacterium]|jgi:cytidyltransferase-like protein|nr:adenylyltransferase/cytidyltransferase family protein [Bacteroidales bacterium]
MQKKVFVSGCFDMLHSGHVAFFEEAASYGDLYVGIGSDRTINELKGRRTINGERERLYMIRSLRCVKDAWINQGSGLLDFESEIRELRPDIFFVNEDGYTPDKKRLCKELGIELVVSRRVPVNGLPPRSTTELRSECRIPYRLDLAGGWLDQPYVSKFWPGAVLTISIEPDLEFNDRSGMSSSTRKKAVELWHTDIPDGDPHLLARTLFCLENPPGTTYVSGSQDAIGIVFPGLNRLDYAPGEYWPEKITTVNDPEVLDFIERHLWFITLPPRDGSFNVLKHTNITSDGARALAEAADGVWDALLAKDTNCFGKLYRASFEAQVAMFPLMKSRAVSETIEHYRDKALGWKLAGAGGGGYLALVSEKQIENAIRIRIRRERTT